MEARLFKSTTIHILQQAMLDRGYSTNPNPPLKPSDGSIWFQKALRPGIQIIIEVQPLHLDEDDIEAFAVNLTRNYYLRKVQMEPFDAKYRIFKRLASRLWVASNTSPEWRYDEWWYFGTQDELERACREALSQLLEYGVPFIESLDAS